MRDDFKYLLALGISILGIFIFLLLFPACLPATRLWTRDMHLQYYASELEDPDVQPDILFLGTSRTMNNVNTPWLNKRYGEKNKKMTTLNLGCNWFGHDLQFVMLDEWLKTKHCKLVVLEVPFLYRYAAHDNFDKLASPEHISRGFRHAPWQALAFSFTCIPQKIYQLLAVALGFRGDADVYQRRQRAGQVLVPVADADLPGLVRDHAAVLARGPVDVPSTTGWKLQLRNVAYAHHAGYLREVARLCREKNVPLRLLAMPGLGVGRLPQELRAEYESLAPLWIPPYDLLQKAGYWRDQSHMLEAGSEALSTWIFQQMEQDKMSELLH